MMVAIEVLNRWADRWSTWVVAGSLDAAALLGLAALVWRLIRHRVPPQVGYALFLLIPLKLLAPVVVTVPEGLARWTPSGRVASWLEPTRPPRAVEPQPRSESPRATPSPDLPPVAGPPRAMPTLGPSAPEATHRTQPTPDPMTARLSWPAVAMIAWMAGVLVLLGRLVASQLRFGVRLRQARPVDGSRLGVDLDELVHLAGVSRRVRFVEADSIASPAVWGIIRPTVILPSRLDLTLKPRELRWVLLHELAHVRRFDLPILAAQRVAALAHFFNPTAWVANRLINQLREYACDDFAASLGQASPVEAGEAFVGILRHADRTRTGYEAQGALGIFGLDPRSSCFSRVRRLLDPNRPARPSMGLPTRCALILLAGCSLPHLRAVGDPAQAPAVARPDQPTVNKVNREGQNEFELSVVGPGGKPVAGASVELRINPTPSAEQIRRGKFIKKGTYGAFVEADSEGKVELAFSKPPIGLNINITTSGFGPYWARWSSGSDDQPVPSRFTAELEAGWSVGGIIVDQAGKPIEGVKVHPSIEFKKRPGDFRQLSTGEERTTDASGRWRFDSVPASMGEVFVEINHPDFTPLRRALTRSGFGIERGEEPAGKIALGRGLTVTGTVTDDEGKPIVGALVRSKFVNNIREAKTWSDGTYKLVGCEPSSARIVVSSKGRATDMREVTVAPDLGPVDFRMKPGGTVRIRVFNHLGQPEARARIFFQRWRGPFRYFEFDQVDQYADEFGVWIWNEAPLDEFKADICPSGRDGMQLINQPIVPRDEEYVFRLPPALVVSGRVIDSATKAPIKRFRVVQGDRSLQGEPWWNNREGFEATDGHYEFRDNRLEQVRLIRIEADGYLPAVSRDIKSDEGKVTVDFALIAGANVAAKVVTPDFKPASGAKVALGVGDAQISVIEGDLKDGFTYAPRRTADAAGRFDFPAQDKDFHLVITHPTGYAHIASTAEWNTVKVIRLQPWSRVEGTFRIGREPAPNVPLRVEAAGRQPDGKSLPNIDNQYQATTGPGGKYVFERVIPGGGWIGRRLLLTVDDGALDVTSSTMIPVRFTAGETIRLDLGGTGRAVVGRLQPPEGFDGKVRWNFALVTVKPEAAEDHEAGLSFTATVGRDGSFRIDDMPEGDYSLNVRFDHNHNDVGFLFHHPCKVPAPDEARPDNPFDLGTLRLKAPGPR